MSLLTPGDQQKLRATFAEMTRPVRLLIFTQAFDCDTCATTRQILDELPPLSDKISIEEINLVLEREKAQQYGVDRVPTVVLVSQDEAGVERDSRIRFLGAPSGYEFVSLVHAVLLVGGGGSELNDASRARVADVARPVTMQVFTTPT